MKKLCVFCVLCLVCLCELRAGDTVRVSIWDRLWEHRSVVASFVELSYRNPAVRYDRYSSSLTRATVGGQYTSESEPVLLQSGDGEKSIGFQADSYIRKKNYCLWGNALYRNGRVKNLKWNETTDWELLYPYLLADSVGGDLSKEIYSFTGGYAARYESITWGGDFSYEASVAYRGIDPRPKNTTSDLSLSLGLSIPVSPSYLFDISVSGRKYKQTNGIKFYSELGVSKVYHLTGLGMHYNRFAGNNYSTYYNGYEWGGSLGVHTSCSIGFVGNVAYRYFSCEKIISSLNELPMARIGRHTFAGELLYRKSLSGIESWGIKLTGNYELKLGTENIFGPQFQFIIPSQFYTPALNTRQTFPIQQLSGESMPPNPSHRQFVQGRYNLFTREITIRHIPHETDRTRSVHTQTSSPFVSVIIRGIIISGKSVIMHSQPGEMIDFRNTQLTIKFNSVGLLVLSS